MNRWAVVVKLYGETVKALKHPGRLLRLSDKETRSLFLKALKEPSRKIDSPWRSCSDPTFQVRSYETYEHYLQLQKGKLDRVRANNNDAWLQEYDSEYRVKLRDRLSEADLRIAGMSVLCLAARIGTEVRSFLDLGCFAVGLDLNPGQDNKFVVFGDFHDIQFPAGCVDVVFTNSLDHSLDIDRVIAEIKRILKPNGYLIIEAVRGSSEGISPGAHESFFWSDIDALITKFEKSSFTHFYRRSFDSPWKGEHLRFKQESGERERSVR